MEDNLNYKISKYTTKLKSATNRRNAEIYQKKLQQYHNLNKTMRGGDLEPSQEVVKMILESKKILGEKLNSKGTSAVYEKEKIDSVIDNLSNKLSDTITNYNSIATDKNALCQNTNELTEEMKKLKPGCAVTELTTDTETLLNGELVKSVCGSTPAQ
jgi:hypothetical protein